MLQSDLRIERRQVGLGLIQSGIQRLDVARGSRRADRGSGPAELGSGFYRNGAHQKINMLIFYPTVSEW